MKRIILNLLIVFFSSISASVVAHYLQWQPEPLVRIICFIVLVLAINYLRDSGRGSISRKECISFLLLTLLFSISIILGYHIVIKDGYNGTMAENYITDYSLVDVFSFILIWMGSFALLLSLFLLIKRKSKSYHGTNIINLSSLGWKWVVGLSLIVFVLFVPWLMAYYPGLVYGDSLNSIRQVLGEQQWSNHFPAAYTFFIKCCFWLSGILGHGNTVGCAIYCIIQMTFMAACFGYMSRWIVVRTQIREVWGFVIAIGLACSPSIAPYSIAIWKDPLFSVMIVMLSLLLFDLVFSRFEIVKQSPLWLILFALSLLSMILLRNNGVYIAALVLLALIATLVFSKRRNSHVPKSPLIVCLLVILTSFAIVGPGFEKAGVEPTPPEERVGIFLNQMARVAAEDGSISDSERDYMSRLLPYEDYPSVYRPCCVDLLKWDSKFNSECINDGFYSYWFSMGIKNPVAYFESWELQTCGFWTINQKDVIPCTNFPGSLRNINSDLNGGGISYVNLFGDEEIRAVLTLYDTSIPAGIINWAIAFILLCLFLLKRASWSASLIPSIGLILTLLIASPIFYWERYEAAVYFLIPFYVALLVMICKGINTKPGQLKNTC